jgi:hypothetical protein
MQFDRDHATWVSSERQVDAAVIPLGMNPTAREVRYGLGIRSERNTSIVLRHDPAGRPAPAAGGALTAGQNAYGSYEQAPPHFSGMSHSCGPLATVNVRPDFSGSA